MVQHTEIKAEMWAFIDELADRLGETARGPRAQVARIVRGAGMESAREMYHLTLDTEAQGGLLLRTVGGVFFYLARMHLSDDLRPKVFPPRRKSQKGVRQSLPAAAAALPLVWEERAEVVADLLRQPRTVSSLKVVLVGRPERVEPTQEHITLWMTDRIERVTVPRGVSRPPSGATLYKVYVAAKQWKRVESALGNSEDRLLIEGIAVFDPDS